MHKQPVVLVGYNRPQYFFSCAVALEEQSKDREVYLFLDGERSEEEKHLVDAYEEIFEKHFPHGTCFRSNENLGVAFNTRRAREETFELCNSAVFIEDDLILNPFYMDIMDSLMEQLKNEDSVGMVNAYGGNTTRKLGENSLENQINKKNKIVTMDHTLAYGAWKNKYEKIKPILTEYYQLLPQEYRARPHNEILKLWRSKGISESMTTTSQDAATVMSMLLNEQTKISTYGNNLLYIGEWGEHSRPQDFKRYEWDEWPVMNELVTEYELTADIFKQTLSELKERYWR